jgi:hypothetical protein
MTAQTTTKASTFQNECRMPWTRDPNTSTTISRRNASKAVTSSYSHRARAGCASERAGRWPRPPGDRRQPWPTDASVTGGFAQTSTNWSAISLHSTPQLCLRPIQPEPHVHLAVHRWRSGEVLLGLLPLVFTERQRLGGRRGCIRVTRSAARRRQRAAWAGRPACSQWCAM